MEAKLLDQLVPIQDNINDLLTMIELNCSLADRITHVFGDTEGLSTQQVEKSLTKFLNRDKALNQTKGMLTTEELNDTLAEFKSIYETFFKKTQEMAARFQSQKEVKHITPG